MPSDRPVLYVDDLGVRMTPRGFTIWFADRIQEDNAEPGSHTRVGMSPELAKELHVVLGAALDEFEKTFRPISIDENVGMSTGKRPGETHG